MSDPFQLGDTEDERFSRRLLLLGGLQGCAFGLLAWRLFDMQVNGAARYVPLAEENRLSTRLIAPKRGRILDRNGNPLADSDEVFRATLTVAQVKNAAAVLARFRRIVPMTDDDVAKIIQRSRHQNRATPIVLATDLTFDQVAKINLLAPDLPGINTELEWRRRYHGGAAVGPVVGFVGVADKTAVSDVPILRLSTMRIGKGGAERAFEAALRGTGGAEKVEVDSRGRTVRPLGKTAAVSGVDISLSINRDLQTAVWSRLTKERTASAVVLDIASGEIRVMVSAPGYDSTDAVESANGATGRKSSDSADTAYLNRATTGQYAPGSIFKIVTALAALEAGIATPEERISCPGHYEADGHTYPCWKSAGHGDVALTDALKVSCDVYFFELARRTGITKLAETAIRLGFDDAAGVSLLYEKAGTAAAPGAANSTATANETLLAGIGQGLARATPLQLSVMAARLASGTSILPTIEKSAASSAATTFHTLPFNAAHLGAIRTAMLASVNDADATGASARLGEKRPLVAGKTGSSDISRLTSETAEDDLEWAKRDHGLFVGYVPADAPRYAIATIVEHGGSGASSAATLARDVLNLVLDAGQPPQAPPASPPQPPTNSPGGAG